MAVFAKFDGVDGESSDSFKFNKPGGEDYLEYKLTNVMVSSYGTHGNGPSSDKTPGGYSEVEWTYDAGPAQYGNPDENDWTY